jgi:hypothetical protein
VSVIDAAAVPVVQYVYNCCISFIGQRAHRAPGGVVVVVDVVHIVNTVVGNDKASMVTMTGHGNLAKQYFLNVIFFYYCGKLRQLAWRHHVAKVHHGIMRVAVACHTAGWYHNSALIYDFQTQHNFSILKLRSTLRSQRLGVLTTLFMVVKNFDVCRPKVAAHLGFLTGLVALHQTGGQLVLYAARHIDRIYHQETQHFAGTLDAPITL